MSSPLTKAIVLITGGNTGLGYATAQALLSSPSPLNKVYTVLLTSRSLTRAQEAAKSLKADKDLSDAFQKGAEVIPLQLDLDDDESIRSIRKEVGDKHGRLDVLVNNAAVNYDEDVGARKKTIREAFNETYNTNVTSVHVLTWSFVGLLLKSADPRLLFISTSVASIAQQQSERYHCDQPPSSVGWPKSPFGAGFEITTYRTSKTALNMLAAEWKKVLKPDGVKVHVINPGLLATGLGGYGADALRARGAAEPIVGGRLVKSVIEGQRDGDLGKMVQLDGVVPW